MATPSARDMLMQVQRYANGGTASAESSVGLARALASGTSQEQYYKNIREYVAKNPNPLAALNAASENGVSMADINSALGTKAASDYFTIDYNTETAPSTNVATGFTSALAQRYNAPGGPGQSTLDKRIKEVSQQYAANTPENAQILRDMFIKEGASIADVQRAGVDPSVLLGTVAKTPVPPNEPKLPEIPIYTPPVVTPETQTQFPQPTPYTATPVYQPLPAPPPIYGAGQPALDVPFRNSPARTYDPYYGYMYTPAAKLLPATGAGMSWTPPSVTSRPRELLKVPLVTATNPQYSASQQFARDRAAAQLAALPAGGGGRFSGMQAPPEPPLDPNAPVDPDRVKPKELRNFGVAKAGGGEIKKSEGSAQEELARFAKGGIIDKAIQKGAEALGFDNERQIAISKEAADLTNQMVDAGLIEDRYRVQLSIPEDVTKRTRLNTGIKGDEEVFNAVNHALFAYDAGQSTLGKVGAQAKELYQGLIKKMGGGDPRSEYLDYFNNKFGFNLAEQGLSREEAKRAIISNVGNLDEQGTRGRLFRGEEIKGGTDLLTNAQDAKYPWEKPLGYDKGGYVTRKQDGGTVSSPMSNAELLAQMDRIGATPNAVTPDRDPVKTESRSILDRLKMFTSLDAPKDMSLGETAADIAMGFAPVVGTAQGLRDFERARRDDDTLGMVLGAASAVPIVGGAVKAARTVGKAAKAGIDLSQIRVRPPSDNITNVRDANFQYPKTIGNQTLDINSITGGVRIDQQEQTRINRLANQISSPEGYISRIIVDQNNNVIEGQHRLEALRQLGAKEVPVYKIEELADTMPVGKMEEAINNAGKIHPDHVNQIMQYALENIAKDGVGNARDYDFGNFQKYYDAALDAIEDGATAGKAPKAADDLAALTAQAPLDMSQASRMQRAAEQGFNTNRPLYHVTNASFDAFEIPENRFRKYGKGVYTSPNLNYVDRYIRENRDIESGYKEGANVMPLYARGNLASEKDWEAARQEMMSEGAAPPGHNRQQEEIQRRLKGKGFDGLNMFGNEIIIFDPSNIRSVNAAFDPAKRGSGNLGYAKGGAVRAYDPLQIENIMSSINAPRNYASGGSVLAYNPGRVDAILNQFRGAV